MAGGTQMSAVQDQLLTKSLLGYWPKKWISELILPTVTHSQYSGKLGKFTKQHLRIVSTIGGGKGKYRYVDSIAVDSDSFDIESHGLVDIVTKRDYKNYNSPFRPEDNKAKALQTMIFLAKEKGLADQLSNTAVITQNTTLSLAEDKYGDYLNSTPVQDFSTARNAVYDGCGEDPNTAIMNKKVWEKLRYHPQLLESLGFKENRPGGLKESELASILEVDKLLIGSAKYNSAKEGQTAVLSDVWGNHIIFAVCPEKASVEDGGGQVALGYTVRLDGEDPRKVYKTPVSNPPGSNEILVEDEYDQLIVDVGAAYLIKDAI